jgi:putative ABC transport system permease protein
MNIALVDPADGDRFSADLTSRALGTIVRPTARARDGDPFAVLERFHLAIAVVTVAGSAAFLIALMVIRAEERRETVGVLRLIGISRRSILLSVVVEALLIALAGAAFGIAVAAAAQYGVNGYFQRRYDTTLVFVRVTPFIAAQAVGIAVPVGVIAGVVASWTALRRQATGWVRR